MAEIVVGYSVAAKPGDWVAIQTTVAGEPMARACVEAALALGAHPTVHLTSDDIQETLLQQGSDEQLQWVSPVTELMLGKADCTIAILAPANTRALSRLDPARMTLASKAREPLMVTQMQRAAEGSLRWTVCAYPTQAAAQDAGMSLREYEEFVYGAALLDETDPPAAWARLGERQQVLIDWLQDKETVHIKGPGTDLKVGIAGRTWVNDRGHENFPGGEIFTGPREDLTEGTIEFTFPAYLAGREVTDVRLVFEGGRVVDFSASGDGAFLRQALEMDEGARVLGEFAFGTNPGITEFSKNTLFDEKMGGTLHMALGRAYPETGGKNVSSLHWDMVYDLRGDTEVRVDGHPFSRNGQLQV